MHSLMCTGVDCPRTSSTRLACIDFGTIFFRQKIKGKSTKLEIIGFVPFLTKVGTWIEKWLYPMFSKIKPPLGVYFFTHRKWVFLKQYLIY